jgi:hypothetical protein
VTVNAVAVDTTAKTVTLTLASSITNADSNIQVSYIPPASNPVQDVAGNTASALSNQSVTNNAGDTTAPATPGLTLAAASDSGTSNSDTLTHITTPTVRVTLNGSGAYAPVAGDTVNLYESGSSVGSATLSATDISNDYVDVTSSTLTPGSKSLTATVTDGANNVSTASSAVSLTLDTTAPLLASASVSGSSLVLSYTETGVGLASTTPAASSFTVSKNGGTAVTVSSVAVDTTNKTVTLTLASALTNADSNIQVSYTPPGSNPVQDVAGNTALALVIRRWRSAVKVSAITRLTLLRHPLPP